MRRPAVFFSASFGSGIFISFHLEMEWLIWITLLTCTAAFFIWSILTDKSGSYRLVCLCLCFAALGGVCLRTSEMKFSELEAEFCKRISINGIVRETEQKDGYCTLVITGDRYDFLVRYYGSTDDIDYYVGNGIKVYGEVVEPQGKRNPGCFDYSLYLKSCGIAGIIDADNIELIPGEYIPLLKITSMLRTAFHSRLTDTMDEDISGMIMAMMFGDKGGMSEEIYKEFQSNGTAHVLAVSGLHVGVLYSFFVFLWRWKKGTGFYVITLIILLMYTALADFSPSVVRAAFMITLHSAAGLMHRRYDLLSAAAVTFAVMLIREPFQLFGAGFQLSFLAIASIGIILPYLSKFYKGIFLASAAVQVGMVPYTAFAFNCFSAGAVLINVPVVFMAGILLPAGLCLMISMIFPAEVFGFISVIMETGCRLMVWINHVFYGDGAACFEVVSPPVWFLFIYYGAVILIMSEAGQLKQLRKSKRQIIAIITAIMISAAGAEFITYDGFRNTAVTFVDVGQGDCIHITTPGGMNYLIDGGGSSNYDVGQKTLKPYLLKNRVKYIDMAFVTHLHEDHYGGIRSLASEGLINKIGVYEANRLKGPSIEQETGAEICYLYAGQIITLDDDVYLEILAPEKKSDSEYKKMMENQEDENSASLIFKIKYYDTEILITGDIDEEGEAGLVQDCGDKLKCDVMKVPHHGSRYSSSETFLMISDPEAAVFQVGKNNYGHPSEEVIERYEMRGAQIFRNDQNGAVGMIIKNDGQIKVVKMVN